jgi:uncharacterized protein (DUF1800 family)
MDSNAAIAFSRFGLGRRRGEPVPADPRGWLVAQIEAPDPTPVAGMPSVADALGILWAFVQAQRAATEMAAQQGGGMAGAAGEKPDKSPDTPEKHAYRAHIKMEEEALLANAITTPAGFRERLVWFWANHFTIANKGRAPAACAGPYVREAIRPHVTGKFRDMLMAVMTHPGMLTYLDQASSTGPDSAVGERRHRGINENLARECLELHTVTPASGYTQADVTAFARLLTGYTVELKEAPRGFRYNPQMHEPGPETIMGRRWPDGEDGPRAFLAWLADHPSTQRHLAEKLVRHFVSDNPSPRDVAAIEAVLRESDGDLGEAAKAVVALPSAWVPLTKLRTPQEYVVATMRAVGAEPAHEPQVLGMVAKLGQPVFGAPFPIGWPDKAADWAGPEALLQRVDFAYQFAGRVTDQEPATVAEETLGPLLSAETLTEIGRAGSRRDGLTLLLASPDFQRR